MLSFVLPNEEKSFNLNAVTGQDEVVFSAGQVTNGPVNGVSQVGQPQQGSPNNNSHHLLMTSPLLTSSPLDNVPRANGSPPGHVTQLPPMNGERRAMLAMDDSYSDDTTTNESALLLRADDRSDEVMTPSTENTRSSPGCDEKPLLPVTVSTTGKTGKLKRVSFGSSKGSMVETLIYDYESVAPLKEEEGSDSSDSRTTSSYRHTRTTSTPVSRGEPTAAEKAASRVRVTYFESKKPLFLPTPDPAEVPTPDALDVPVSPPPAPPEPPGHTQVTATAGEMPTTYIVQTIDAGWENPFRPGGELSKEADAIVRAIQAGKPLDTSEDSTDAAAAEAAGNGHLPDSAPNGGPAGEPLLTATVQTTVAAPAPAQKNGQGAGAAGGGGEQAPLTQTAVAAQTPGTVEVQHTLVRPEDGSQVQQVTLKKKPRGKCCVVQ